jgi:predicted MFS family arabinose efflux permease
MMSTELSPERERRLLLTLMILQFTVIVDFMVMMPLSPQLMAAFHIEPGQFGLLVSSYSIAAGASSLLAASIADRFDRRHALLATYVGLLVATLGCASASDFYSMLIARAVAGVFGGVISSISLAIVGDVIPPQRRGHAMGIVMLAFSLAAIAGVPLGLVISNFYGWRMPFASLSLACGLILLVAWRQVPPVRGHLGQEKTGLFASYGELLSVPNHWWGFISSALIMFSGFLVIPYIAPAMVANVGLTIHQLPYIYLTGGAVTLLTRPWIAGLTDRHRHADVLAFTVFASFVPIVLVTHTLQLSLAWQLAFAALFFIFVSGRFIPAAALVTASTQPRLRGRVMAFNSALQNLASGLAAMVAGFIMYKGAGGHLMRYEWVGYLGCAAGLIAVFTSRKVRAVS